MAKDPKTKTDRTFVITVEAEVVKICKILFRNGEEKYRPFTE